MKNFCFAGLKSLLAVFAASVLIFVSGCSPEKENIGVNIDDSDYNKNIGLRFSASIRNDDGTDIQVIKNGTLEKGKYEAGKWEINMEWIKKYQGKVKDLEIKAIGTFPNEILQTYAEEKTTSVDLWIVSEKKFEEDDATSISNLRKTFRSETIVEIDTTDRNYIISAFQKAFDSFAESTGLKESPVIIDNTKYNDVKEVDKYSDTQPGVDIPVLDPNIPEIPGEMFFQFNNMTNGRFRDDEIYIVILGYRPQTRTLIYVDHQGNTVDCSENMNTLSLDYGRIGADVSFKVSDAKYVRMPDIESGRMYISYEKPVYVTFLLDGDNNLGFAGPDINNNTDPNFNTYFEFAEFTLYNGQYWGNTTRVDFFTFPVITRLLGQGYDQTVGEIGTRDQIMAAWAAYAPIEFQSLKEEMRIYAPCKRSFDHGEVNGNYFQAYIDELWAQYTDNDLVFHCEAGTFTGRVDGDGVMRGKIDGLRAPEQPEYNLTQTIVIRKPNTQEVLEGKGALADGHFASLVVQAQLCAAINRGVAHDGALWGNTNAYYNQPNVPYNFYSKFWHDNSIGGLAYGFCYDDVFDQATLLYHSSPTALVMDLKWN